MNPMLISSKKFFTLLLFLSFYLAKSQITTRDSARSAQLYGLSLGAYQPMGDMSLNYRFFSSAEVEYLVKNKKGQFIGASFKAHYGNAVKDVGDIFSNLTDANGNFLGVNGEFATIQAGMSGGQIMFHYGKLVRSRYNPNSGWLLFEGLGIGQHKIGLRDQRGTLPQLQSPFLEGYDRLHIGAYMNTSVRYLHLDNNERVNWAATFSINTGASRNIRGFIIDTGEPDTSIKFDLFFGGALTWYIPLYRKQESFYLID